MVMKPMRKRITFGAIALLIACVLVAIAVVAVTYYGSTPDDVTSTGASEGEISEVEAASAEVPDKIDPEQPYAKLEDDQIKSVYFNLDGCDPYGISGNSRKGFLSYLRRLTIYPEPLEGFDVSDFDDEYAFREDQFVVTLEDGSSFTVAPYGKTADGDAIVLIDGQAFAAKRKDPVYELQNLCRLYKELLSLKDEGIDTNVTFIIGEWDDSDRGEGVTRIEIETNDQTQGATGDFVYTITPIG